MRSQKNSSHGVLRDKGEFTEFQILLEVMRSQPHVKQKDVSEAVGITVQAVSKYFKQLIKEGFLEAGSERADYRLTAKATERLYDYLKRLSDYAARIKRDLKIESLLPALAIFPVKEGEDVGIVMKEGVLYTVRRDHPDAEAWGVTVQAAEAGEDVGLRNVRGKVKAQEGKVVMIRLPSIREGGSRSVNLTKIKRSYEEFNPDRIGVVGVVGRAVLKKLTLKADFDFGITRATALAAERGLRVFVLVVGRMINRVIEEIDNTNVRHGSSIAYEVRDGR